MIATTILKAMINASPMSMSIWNKKMQLVMCNDQTLHLFNFDHQEQYVEALSRLSPQYQPNGRLSDELRQEKLDEAFAKGETNFQWLYCDSQGHDIQVEIHLKVLNVDGDEYVMDFIKDIRSEFIDNKDIEDIDGYFLNKISDKYVLNKVSACTGECFFAFDTRTGWIQLYEHHDTLTGGRCNLSFDLNAEIDADYVHKDDVDLYSELIGNIKVGLCKPLDIRFKQFDGTYRYYRYVYSSDEVNDHNTFFVIGIVVDVHEQKKLEDRSEKDLLTGCYNKVTGEHVVANKIRASKEKTHALLIIDLDDFKSVNDTFGHFYGDKVLKDVASVLTSNLRQSDIVVRIGGDEFVMFIENMSDINELKCKGLQIIESIKAIYAGEQCTSSISGSIGIALYPNDAITYDDLYQSADKALYQAKRLGKNKFIFYDESFKKEVAFKVDKINNHSNTNDIILNREVITSVSDILYNEKTDDDSINAMLSYICNKYAADRCYIFETDDNGITYDNTYEWCAKGISCEINNLQSVDGAMLKYDFFDSSHNGIIYCNDLNRFHSTDAFILMENQGIKSFAHAQVRKDNYVSFFIGLDDCTHSRIWSEEEINTLQFIGHMASIILQSKRLSHKLQLIDDYNTISIAIADNSNDVVYVSDIDTFELIYMNKGLLKLIGNPPENVWKNAKCYELLQNKTSPCDFCTNSMLNTEEFFQWTYQNKTVNKEYHLQDKLIYLGERVVRLEIATDITLIKSTEQNLKKELEEKVILIKFVETLYFDRKPDSAIKRLLSITSDFYDADRSYIFEVSNDRLMVNNTFEKCKEGCTSYIDAFKNISIDNYAALFNELNTQKDSFVYEESNCFLNSSSEFSLSGVKNVHSILMVPIKSMQDVIVGFIGVDNARKHVDNTSPLYSVVRIIDSFLNEIKSLHELNQVSFYDVLTGVKNRISYRNTLEKINNDFANSLGVAYFDIHQLSAINEERGLKYGDSVISRVANMLMDIFPEDVYRIDGDEFVVIRDNIDEKTFNLKMSLLESRLNQDTNFKVSIGYTWNEKVSKGELITGSGGMYNRILANTLDKELDAGKFVVYLQPQINLKTGYVDGAEALIRRCSDGVIQPPISFIPFYEKEGIISKIDIFVLEEVCKLIKGWNEGGYKNNFNMSINCSRVTVRDKNIVDKFMAICDTYGVAPSQIVIEITETINGADDEILSSIINNFSKAGFKVSLDDFGNGYSNFSSLILSDFDEVKIDMKLIKDISTSEKSKKLTKVALMLCTEIDGLSSVAEGIETEEQYEILKWLDCDRGQGYFFDKPMPIKAFTSKYIMSPH